MIGKMSAFEKWCWRRLLRVPWIAEIQAIHFKGDQSWVFFGRTDAKAETPVLWPPHVKSWLIWKDPDAGRDLGAGGEGDDRGWDGWMASPTRWTWIWVNSKSLWWTGRPGLPWFMGLQRVRHDWATELNWTDVPIIQTLATLISHVREHFSLNLKSLSSWKIQEKEILPNPNAQG